MRWRFGATVVVAGLLAVACSAPDDAGARPTSADARPAPTFAAAAADDDGDGPAPTFAPAAPALPGDPPPAASTGPAPSTGPAISTPTNDPRPTAPAPEAVPDGQLVALGGLVVASETDTPYDRNLFGGRWIDADSDGCDTRCEVLRAERRTDIAGLGIGWVSVYDGYSTPDASELDIDHMVPLAEAWRSGADRWDGDRRIAFANDLDVAASLIAVTAASNRSKGDKDPAHWQPPNPESWCSYTSAWIDTKRRWGLTADQDEVRALRNMITARHC